MKNVDYGLVEDYVNEVRSAERCFSHIETLHRFVDAEEIDTAKKGYTSSIHTDVIRQIFGWDTCAEAKRLIEEREAKEKEEKRAKATVKDDA